MSNRSRNEADTRAELIDPLLKSAGWGMVDNSRIRREVLSPGRLQGAGLRSKPDIADYVLTYNNQKLAVIEAKRESLPVTEGLAQAKRYADKLQVRYAYSTNGHGIYRVDMHTGEEGEVDSFAAPEELWHDTYQETEERESYWRRQFASIDFDDKSGQWELRYYQHNAVNNVMEAIVKGRDRILITLATGTGKTAIAFQIVWKLYHSRWNLTDWKQDQPGEIDSRRRPRILFLADRNILADQASNNFSSFPEDARVRIDPETIRKKGRVPKNGSIFFTIFQTFMTGANTAGSADNSGANFYDYPADFFDFIIIDECHRGGANDESSWRAILEYFAPAVQLGLTATPKRTNNIDTYAYFGEPVYIYSLKDGINDGYLTPFKVKQIQTTLDEYVYTTDDEVIEGQVEDGKRYGEDDFNRIIEIQAREKKRVEIFMEAINQKEKTIVFCATQEHALAVRNLVNQIKDGADPDYCVRVTARDGKTGDQFLRTFQDNEKTIPTILTTSQKLSTGVDARNVRNIVLMRPINSMIEFKQIIGRGTRLYDGKDYFTIYDFVKAYEHFNDPEWDGEPVAPESTEPRTPESDTDKDETAAPRDAGDGEDPQPRPERLKIKLADGKERHIQHMMVTSYWSPDGKPLAAAQFLEKLFGDLPLFFKSEARLREIWSRPDTRKGLLDGLEEQGYGREQLAELSRIIDAENSDLYDVLAYTAFAIPTITRVERVNAHRSAIYQNLSREQTEFIDFVLEQYVKQGVGELDSEKLPHLIELKYHSIHDASTRLGNVTEIREMFLGFQKHLYTEHVA